MVTVMLPSVPWVMEFLYALTIPSWAEIVVMSSP